MVTPSDELKQFVNFSEERLFNVKNGQTLAGTLKNQKNRFKNFPSQVKGAEYDSTENLLRKNIIKLPRDLSPAMREYYNTANFSPILEVKKSGNLEKFFLVKIIKEKYQIVNAFIQPAKMSPSNYRTKYENKKRESIEDEYKIHQVFRNPFSRKLSEIDRKVELMLLSERAKKLEAIHEDKFAVKSRKKIKKGIFDKFYVMNMKARMNLHRKSTENCPTERYHAN